MDYGRENNLKHRGTYEQNLTTPTSFTSQNLSSIGSNSQYSSMWQNNAESDQYRLSQPSFQHGTSHDWTQKLNKLKKVLGEEIHTASQIFHAPSPSQYGALTSVSPTQSPTAQTSITMITNLLQQRIPYLPKCEDIYRICCSCTSKELIEIYPLLLHDIFGFSNGQGWGLCKYDPKVYSHEFNPVFDFMSSKGYMFKIIDKLMLDKDAVFHFPFSSLSAGIKESIEKGQAPMWYDKKAMMLPDNQPVVNFNAWEYFVALFAHYIRHPQILMQSSNWSGIEDILYVRLLEEYLHHFFPIDEQILQTSQPPASLSRPIQSFLQKQPAKSDIWKSPHLLSPTTSPAYNTQLLQTSNQSDSFLQILCDFWLTVNSEEYLLKQQECKLPSVDHARVVRILVKYLHTFTNTNQDETTQTFAADNYLQIQAKEFKSVVIPSLVHQKLFLYLKHCFKHWPLDSSFRMLLETWLSFIQPWRYMSQNVSMHDDSIVIDLTNWRSFVADNFPYYSVLFQMFLARAIRYDLKSIRDIQLIYRVAKVFSQPSLIEFLRQDSLDNSPGSLRGIPTGLQRRVQFDRTADSSSTFFDLETTNLAHELCQMLATTVVGFRHNIISATSDNKQKGNGFFNHLKEFFTFDESSDQLENDRDNERLMSYLEQSSLMLNALFKFQSLDDLVQTPSAMQVDIDTNRLPRPGTTVAENSSLPDCVVSENGIMLTDKGRYQIIQGLRQFNIIYSGDPELQPIRSYESTAAVRLLYRVATTLNTKYSTILANAYNRQDFFGISLKKISQKLIHSHYVDTPISLPRPTLPRANNELVEPRISLRFAGSYYFMGYFCWMIILARLFGFSWITIGISMILIWMVCVLCHIDSPPRKLQPDRRR